MPSRKLLRQIQSESSRCCSARHPNKYESRGRCIRVSGIKTKHCRTGSAHRQRAAQPETNSSRLSPNLLVRVGLCSWAFLKTDLSAPHRARQCDYEFKLSGRSQLPRSFYICSHRRPESMWDVKNYSGPRYAVDVDGFHVDIWIGTGGTNE